MDTLALFGGTPVRTKLWPRPRMLAPRPELVRCLAKVLDEGLTLFSSDTVKQLEQKLAENFGRKYCVAVSSGTAALETALYAVGVRSKQDEVIVPSATYISSATAIKRNGGNPIFVDCDDSLTMSVDELLQAITPCTKAVVFVSLFGNPGNITDVYQVCKNANIPLIHDCAQGAASKREGRWIASLGDISCLSFYETKHLAGGEGGALLLDQPDIYQVAKSFSNLFEIREDGIPTSIEPDFRRMVYYPDIGTNYRLSSLTAVLVNDALDRLESTKQICMLNGQYYLDHLRPWGNFPTVTATDEVGWYGVPILLRKKNIRDGFWRALQFEGTPVARYYYTYLPTNNAFGRPDRSYPVTESLVADTLVLPTHLAIGAQEIADLTDAIAKVGNILCQKI